MLFRFQKCTYNNVWLLRNEEVSRLAKLHASYKNAFLDFAGPVRAVGSVRAYQQPLPAQHHRADRRMLPPSVLSPRPGPNIGLPGIHNRVGTQLVYPTPYEAISQRPGYSEAHQIYDDLRR